MSDNPVTHLYPPETDDDYGGGDDPLLVVDVSVTDIEDKEYGSRMLIPSNEPREVADAILRCARGAAATVGGEVDMELERLLLMRGKGDADGA